MDPPGRTNNLYKERLVVDPTIEIRPEHKEESQGCMFARTAGYGTFEYCSTVPDTIPVPPRRFQLDFNIQKIDAIRRSIPIDSNKELMLLGGIVIAALIFSRL